MSSVPYKPVLHASIIATFSFLCSYGLNVSVARFFSATLFGDFALTLSVLGVLFPLVTWGGHIGMVRFVSKYLAQNECGMAYQYMRWAIKIFLLFSLVVLFATLLFTWLSSTLFNHTFFYAHHHLLMYALWLTPIAAAVFMLCGMLAALKYGFLSTIGQNGLRYFFLLVFVLLLANIFPHHGVLTLFTAIGLGVVVQLIVVALVLLWAWQRSCFRWQAFRVRGSASAEDQRTWFCFGRTACFQSMIGFAAAAVMLAWLEWMGKSPEEVGYLAAFMAINGVIYVLNQSLGMVMQSMVARHASLDERVGLQRQAGIIQAISLAVNVVLGAVIIVYGRFFLGHFGVQYLHLLPLLRWYLLLHVIASYLVVAKTFCFLMGYQDWVLRITVGRLLCFVVVGGLAVHHAGFEGAALAECGIYLLNSMATSVVVYVKTGISLLPFGWFSRCAP